MTSKVSRERHESGSLGRLRVSALIAVLVGAVGSVGLTLRTGASTDQPFLVILVASWVFAPFAALVFAHAVARGWSMTTQATLYWLMLALTLGSLAVYVGDAFGPPTTAVYVGVPLASWLLIALVLPIAGFISGRRRRADDA